MWQSFNVHTHTNIIAFKITDIALRKALDNSEFLISKQTLNFALVLLGAKVLMSFFCKIETALCPRYKKWEQNKYLSI